MAIISVFKRKQCNKWGLKEKLKKYTVFSAKPGTWQSTHQHRYDIPWPQVTASSLQQHCTNFFEVQVRSFAEIPCLKDSWERLIDSCAANTNFTLAQTGAAPSKLRKSRILLHRNRCLHTVFHRAIFHGLHFLVIKIGCYPTSGGEDKVRDLVPISEVAAKAAEQHVFLVWNISLILKNNNIYHLLQPFIIDKIWAVFDCKNPFQHECRCSDEEVLQSNLFELSYHTLHQQVQLSLGTHTGPWKLHLSFHWEASASSHGKNYLFSVGITI